jgi:hypothetical protein
MKDIVITVHMSDISVNSIIADGLSAFKEIGSGKRKTRIAHYRHEKYHYYNQKRADAYISDNYRGPMERPTPDVIDMFWEEGDVEVPKDEAYDSSKSIDLGEYGMVEWYEVRKSHWNKRKTAGNAESLIAIIKKIIYILECARRELNDMKLEMSSDMPTRALEKVDANIAILSKELEDIPRVLKEATDKSLMRKNARQLSALMKEREELQEQINAVNAKIEELQQS